jgi:hypothetical protein
MVEITNANDVELILSSSNITRGTSQSQGRIVVDEFSISREETSELISGVGMRLPAGYTNGDITHNFSFTMMGEDVRVFSMVAEQDGQSIPFDFTAQKVDGNGETWSFALQTCKATSEEISGSSGDPVEYAVEGFAVGVIKNGTTEDGNDVW